MDFNKIEAEERHIFKLWTRCRVCGQAGEKLQYCLDNYNDLLHELYSIDISKDDPAVHPQMVCQKCRLILQHYLKKGPKLKNRNTLLPALPSLYTFNRHSGECGVCDGSSGLLPKRKCMVDSAENISPAKAARQDDGSVEDDRSTCMDDTSTQNKGSSEELIGSSHDSDRANVLLQAIQGAIGEEAILDNPEEAVHKPDEQEGFTKYVYLNMIRRFKARGIKEDKSQYSVDVSRFRQKNFAATFLTCSLCKRLPLKPVTTECKHVFCETCISDWLNFGNVCPKCEEVIVELSDATEHLRHLYLLLDAPCSFASKGCEVKLTPFEINKHERECPFNGKTNNPSDSSEEEEPEHQEEVDTVEKAAPRKRKALRFVTPRLAKTRTKELTDFVDNTCIEEREDKIDVLFYMLKNALADSEDYRAKDVDLLWRNNRKSVLRRRRTRGVAAAPLPRPQRQINRRKGTPRKRGRPRKVPLSEDFVESDPELNEEVQECEDDTEDTDATWNPPSGLGRGQDGGDTKEGPSEKDDDKDSEKSSSAVNLTGVEHENVNTNILVVQVVEGSETSTDAPSVTIL